MTKYGKMAAIGLSLAALWSSAAWAEPVKIALPVASLESMPIYIAQDKGFFKKHGVEVDVITSRGGGEAMKAYLAKEVDIVATGFPEVGLMRARGVDVELFFAQTSRVPFAMISRKDLKLKSVAELKGKTVAVTSPGSLTSNLARYFVKQAGLDPDKDVSFVSVGGGGELLGALKSSRADAAMLFEPFVTVGIQTGIADMLVDVPQQLDAFSSSPLATSKTFVEKRPKEARAVFDALAESLKIIHGDKATTLEIAKKVFTNADTKVLEAALARMEKSYSQDGRFTRANVDQTQKISVDMKIMPKVFPYEDVVAPMAREGGK
ncbi:ABC transporter substrate-binding protein [Pseudolabrys taiwanensis]|uniref:ABC transporter substrate-binding protein n=1 Tax=Pseudolabrys taiwanensis TaxID=331696 RepID=A0A345ZX55_9HYPH|nr:ABC transporter substrate-binding protein [Pseudolabrys taiwanensis]AXK81502.1 ABC transporter substrate-binding protein [Pseudolabrys taiwanensis]